MWFGVLGPLLVRDGNSVIGVPAARQRVLLAALLVRAGSVVAADALAEVVWDGAPPTGAETTLRSYLMRLRRVLGPAAGARVVTRFPGYLVEASEEEVDLLRFRALYREGGSAVRAADWESAWALLTECLALWRGEPLADVPSDLLHRAVLPGLEELRVQALEWRVDAGLRVGRHGELVAELQSLVGRFPLREGFAAQLMLALVRCGRQVEALEAYQRARGVLVEQLGTEPGTELRDLHRRILTGDPALTAARFAASASAGAGGGGTFRPREVPAPVAGFVGRAGELAALTGLLDRSAGQAAQAIVITAIGGTAGVGKTALAVQWAHQVADRFPDGQLYVNLRGYDPDRPMTAADVLAGFLRSLGVRGQDIPPEEDERAARYRSLLAGKHMLVVLDNARSVDQVRPLLPGSASCAVVVTSRESLAGLVAREGANRLELDLLAPSEAVTLLRALIGARVDEDAGAAKAIAELCCRLPLALRVAAELAAGRPDVPLAELAGELADQQRRLDLLDAGGDLRTAIRAVFSWSFRHLDPDAARAFALAGLHPGPDFDPYAVAALTGTGLDQARAVLDTLARAHLFQPTRPGRYGLHDLLRVYARELAAADGQETQNDALTRLFDHYLHTVSLTMDTLYPAVRHRRPRIPPPATPIPPVGGPAAARAWLDAERANLVAVTTVHGLATHATQLSVSLFYYLDHGGHYPEAMTIHSRARAAAHLGGDRAGEAMALNNLAAVHLRQGRCQQAADHLRQVLALFREAGDRAAQADVLNNLGLILQAQGCYQEAIGVIRQALAIYRETNDLAGEATALNNLGVIQERQGRYDLAAGYHRQALAISAEIGTRVTECIALVNLGTVSLRQGRYRQADGHLRRALALSLEVGYRDGEAGALIRIGELCLRQGHPDAATGHLWKALAVHREIGSPSGEADALNSLGEVFLAAGRPGDVRAQHAAALGLAVKIGDKYQQARAHHGLGQACRAGGDPGGARRYWQVALALFTELGVPEAGRVRAQLTAAYSRRRTKPFADGAGDGAR